MGGFIHKLVGRNPHPPFVSANVAEKLKSLDSGFRQNDAHDAMLFVCHFTIAENQVRRLYTKRALR